VEHVFIVGRSTVAGDVLDIDTEDVVGIEDILYCDGEGIVAQPILHVESVVVAEVGRALVIFEGEDVIEGHKFFSAVDCASPAGSIPCASLKKADKRTCNLSSSSKEKRFFLRSTEVGRGCFLAILLALEFRFFFEEITSSEAVMRWDMVIFAAGLEAGFIP
jgi:hypothetical protein